jgi:uncharacterized iron-regulated protein
MKLRRLCNYAALGSLVAACASQVDPKSPAQLPTQTASHRPLPPGAVAANVSSYSALGVQGVLDAPELFGTLSQQHVVCLGEQHDNIAHHSLQFKLVKSLLEQAATTKQPIAIGFEMFTVGDQPLLDAYAQGTLSEAELLTRTNYAVRWGYDFEFYRSVMEWGRGYGAKLLALNAPKEWTRAVVAGGAAGLQTVQADLSPKDLVLNDPQHQHFFEQAMAGHAHVHGHGVSTGNLEQDPMYTAQVVWDETMARSAARWLAATGPDGRVLVLAGAGHCHRSAILRRMERRLPGARTLGVRLLTRSDMAAHIQSGFTPSPPNSDYELLVIAEQ